MLNDAVAWGIKGLCDLALEVAPLSYQDLRAVLAFQEGSLVWAEAFVERNGKKVSVEAIKGLAAIRKSLLHLEIYTQLFHDTFDAQAEDISSPTPMHRSFGDTAALNTKQIRIEYFEHCAPEGDFSWMPDHADFQLEAIMITFPILNNAVKAAMSDPSKVGPLDIPGTPETFYGIRGRLQDCIVHRGLDSIQRCVEGEDLKVIQSFVAAIVKAWRKPKYKWRSITYDISKVKRRSYEVRLLEGGYEEWDGEDEDVVDRAKWDDSAAEDDTDVESPHFLYRGGFCPTPEEDWDWYHDKLDEEKW